MGDNFYIIKIGTADRISHFIESPKLNKTNLQTTELSELLHEELEGIYPREISVLYFYDALAQDIGKPIRKQIDFYKKVSKQCRDLQEENKKLEAKLAEITTPR